MWLVCATMWKHQISFIFIFACLTLKVDSQGYCSLLDPWGPDLNETRENSSLECIDAYCKSFLVFDRRIDCYGKIREWEFSYSDVCHDVLFQIYRPISPGSKNYTLVGENLLEFTSLNVDCATTGTGVAGQSAFAVSREMQIPVQPDDVIGWQDVNFAPAADTTNRLFKYAEGNTGSTQFDVIHVLEESDACDTVGQSCPWDTSYGKVLVVGRTYSLNAFYLLGEEPLLENLPGYAQVAEHQPPGIFVFQVIASNNRNWNEVVPIDITYGIETIFCNGRDVTNDDLFSMNKTTGEVFTMKELDHEEFAVYDPDGSREAFCTINILVKQGVDGPENNNGVLTVHVRDVNERHDITNLPFSVTLDTETTGAGAQIYQVLHEELENEEFGTRDNEAYWPLKKYMMVNTDPALDVFAIDQSSGVVTTTVDLASWQGKNTTQLYITCTDYYYTTSPKVLTVTLTNYWKPPHLENLPNAVSVPETTTDDASLYTVTSWVDPRASPTYTISGVHPPLENPSTGTNPFGINANSGVVSISNAMFDYRVVQKYEVEIKVNDGLFDSISENLTVEITFVNTPPFWIEENYRGSIPELSPQGTVIPGIHLQASDLDIPVGDWIDYVISGQGSHLFHADNVTNRVHVVAPHTLQCGIAEETFTLQMDVLDSSGAFNSAHLDITVTDVNNNAPEFDSRFHQGKVNELWVGGTVVPKLFFSVSDCDSNERFGRVDIVVVEEYARKYFEVSPYDCPTTCVQPLVLKQPINYTDHTNMTFTMLASDRGSPRLNDTAVVFIEVTDENNHPPEFVSPLYDTEERDDVHVDTTVTTLEVTDLDSERNSQVTFFLLLPDDHFRVEGNTGAVKNFKGLNSYKKYILYAYARDYADPEFYSDPSIVRIDTYPPADHLVDIHMQLPLDEFKLIVEDFLAKLNTRIAPWVAKQELNLLDKDRSILTIYALTEYPPATPDSLYYDKTFVSVDDLLGALRTDMQGTPKDWLRGPDFSEYQVFKVVHTYPVWLVDTIPGIVTLTLLCLLILLLLLLLAYFIYKRCVNNKVEPEEPKRVHYRGPDFDLRYGDYNHLPRRTPPAYPGLFATSASGQHPKKPKMNLGPQADRAWDDTALPNTPV